MDSGGDKTAAMLVGTVAMAGLVGYAAGNMHSGSSVAPGARSPPVKYVSKLKPAVPSKKQVIPASLERRGEEWLKIAASPEVDKVSACLSSVGIYQYESPSGFNDSFVVETICAQKRSSIETLEQIGRDLPRTYPDVDFFSDTDVRDALGRILRAIALEYPDVGYVQGMNFLGANIMLHMNGKEDKSFLLFRYLMENPRYRLLHVFQPDLPNLRRFSDILESFISTRDPELYMHFEKVGLEPLFYSQNWIMTLFSYMVPFEPLAEIWDRFLRDGWSVIFKAAFALFELRRDALLKSDFEGCARILREVAEQPPKVFPSNIDSIVLEPEDLALIDKAVAMEPIDIVAAPPKAPTIEVRSPMFKRDKSFSRRQSLESNITATSPMTMLSSDSPRSFFSGFESRRASLETNYVSARSLAFGDPD
mmetsp:Transcript_84/g.199  ORF Transcript_84/g.199 Transcript_84/m.199 type:complete len:421 (+) Transcript_84:2484-3746(+)